jgi:hypothetical protein
MTARYRLTLIHCVPDYERWAEVVREHGGLVPGVVSMTVYRSIDDPNEVMVEAELESADAARDLIPSTSLRDLLDRAGVEIYPPVFIGEVDDDLSIPGS